MRDLIVLAWIASIFFGAVFFSCSSIYRLIVQRKFQFDKGFLFSLSAVLSALLLSLFIWPPAHRVYNDEFAFMSQSVNILDFGKPSTTEQGSRIHPEEFDAWTNNPKLPGFSWLEAVVYFLTRDFEHSYFVLNIILGALSAGLIYRIVWLWGADHLLAWWSAVFLACLPVRIAYSMSASSDIAGLFFFLLFVMFFSEYRILNTRNILYAALFSGIYSICVKPVYGIYIVAGILVGLNYYRKTGLLDKKEFSQVWLDIFCLFLPVLCAVPLFFFFDSVRGGYSLSFIYKNICTDFLYLFDPKQSVILPSITAMIAVGSGLFYKKDILTKVLAGWFLIGVFMVSIFYAGGFSYPGVAYSDRYFLPLVFPYVILAAMGMNDLIKWLKAPILNFPFFILLIVNAYFSSAYLTREAGNVFHYKETLLIRKMLPLVSTETYILDSNAVAVTLISDKKAILTDLFLKGTHPKSLVYLKGISDVINDYDNTMDRVSIDNVLRRMYQCKPLTGSPLEVSGLSATPYICIKSK